MINFLAKRLTPTQMSQLYVGLGICAVIVISVGVMTVLESDKKPRVVRPEITNIITDKNSRTFGLDAVNDKLTALDKRYNTTAKEVERLTGENARLSKNNRSSAQLAKELDSAISEIKNLKKKMKDDRDSEDKRIAAAVEHQIGEHNITQMFDHSNPKTESNNKYPDLPVDPTRRKTKSTAFSYGEANKTGSTNREDRSTKHQSVIEDARTEQLFTVIENDAVVEEVAKKEIYVPRGSILTGVLITGLDAPTRANSSDQPIPTLVRLKKEAILPNFATVEEVNECFAILGGYGDLSSERAFLRGESITCVRENGTIIEADFKSFAVGEDGKNGLKGTLISRNSTVLANAMMAGFASGMASMFDVNPVPTISTSTNGSQQYQEVFSTSALQGGAAKGASTAITKLADYYMELADAIHPVIEIGSGRVIDMVVTQGTEL